VLSSSSSPTESFNFATKQEITWNGNKKERNKQANKIYKKERMDESETGLWLFFLFFFALFDKPVRYGTAKVKHALHPRPCETLPAIILQYLSASLKCA
jgi:hypothetical protein